MVAFRNLATLLSLTAIAAPLTVLATEHNIDFKDISVKPNEVKPLTYSNGYRFENIDILGGVLDSAGDIVVDVLALLGLGGKKGYSGVGIIGGIDGHYKKPTRIYHPSGKPFNVLSLKALCCAADLSKHCNLLDCHIKLSGFDHITSGKKIYDHDFYIPRPSKHGKSVAPIEIDVEVDGVLSLGDYGSKMNAIEIEVQLLDIVDADVKVGGKPPRRHRGRYSYKPSHSSGPLGLGLIIDIELDIELNI